MKELKIKEIKKILNEGNHILLWKTSNHSNPNYPFKWEIKEKLNDGLGYPEYYLLKLIHKKHEEVLNAWLLDNDVEIEYGSNLQPQRDNDVWGLQTNFIDSYDEDKLYRLKEAPLFSKEAEETLEDLGDMDGIHERLEDLKKEKPVSLKQISKDIDTLIDTATPFQMEVLAQWLKNKSECVECIGILEESYSYKNQSNNQACKG